MIRYYLLLCLCTLTFFSGCASLLSTHTPQSISPISFGLYEATTGEDRYNILLSVHKYACKNGLSVDYTGIHTIEISIPKGAESIPLCPDNNFAGVVLNVKNKAEDTYLFTYTNREEKIDIPKKSIDRGVFKTIKRLNKGINLLIIEDDNPWVKNRKGYSYGHKRRDILLLHNGKALNQTIMPYNNEQSLPSCKFYNVIYPYLRIENITINRQEGSTFKSFLCNIVGANKVLLNNVVINTQSSDLVDDVAIRIVDCTNVSFENVTINGTYSQPNHSGYGISMNNVWNFSANNLMAYGEWGVFGNNNINTATITNSTINRFDVHCYGREVSFKNVTFRRLYNQFSSIFGSVLFDNCTFDDFIPVLYEPSYEVQSKHDIIFRNCVFMLTKTRNYLVSLNTVNKGDIKRPELCDNSWPSVSIEKMIVNVSESATDMMVFLYPKSGVKGIDRISDININDLEFKYSNSTIPVDLYISNVEVSSATPVKINVNKLDLTSGAPTKSQATIGLKGRFITNIKQECISVNSAVTKSHISNSLLSE